MLNKRFWIVTAWVCGLTAGYFILQGCGKVSGDRDPNQPPTVQIVNVPQDAWGVDTTYHFAMPFQVAAFGQPTLILSMQGTTMLENLETVYHLETVGDSTIVHVFQRDVHYTMDYAAGTLTALSVAGGMELGTAYLIDFAFLVDNYYVFSYAPMIHWVGFDANGFIDRYSYADDTTAAFINGYRDAEDPQLYLREHDDQLTWHDTTAMEARIYLMTTEGDTTEHLFIVKAVDNEGTWSQDYAVKTFFRSNNAPDNPLIKPLEAPDADFTQNYVVEDTLFSLGGLTPLWQGISFNWTGSDPDDKELYQIPLKYTHYLVKTPGDTIWAWSDSVWSDTKQIQLFGLETASYTFSVWTQDDGYTLCAEPATSTFNAVHATLQYHILMIDETKNSGFLEVPGDSVNVFWQSVLQNLEGQLDNDNYVMDGVDVRFKDNSADPAPSDVIASPIPYALIGQYKLVLIYNDDHANANNNYIENRDQVLSDYLDIGGNVWMEGRKMMLGMYGFLNFVDDGTEVPISSTFFLGKYMQMQTAFVSNKLDASEMTEFKGALPAVEELPEMVVDSNRVNLIMQGLTPNDKRYLLPEVDWLTRGDQAVSLYTFNSITSDTSVYSSYVNDEDSDIDPGATPVQCTLVPAHQNLLEVYSVQNVTLGVTGEVLNFSPSEIIVSYPYGQPWNDSDSLDVDYRYDPITQMHLKPVAARFENQPRIAVTIVIQGFTFTYYTTTLGYRTAFFTFPLFFMKNDQGQVDAVVREMLNWFFYPTIHQAF